MKYYSNHKFAFLHIPKTAGTSVDTLLNRYLGTRKVFGKKPGQAHRTMTYVKDLLPKDTTVMTILRIPYEIPVSLYHWFRISTDYNNYPHKASAKRLSFKEWMYDYYLDKHKSIEDFILVDGKVPDNLLIGKKENLVEDLDKILNGHMGFGIKIELPHMYKTKHNHYNDYLDSELKREIEKKDRWVFDSGFYNKD